MGNGRPIQVGQPLLTTAFRPIERIPAMSSVTTDLPAVVAEHIAAVNAFDTERIVGTFAADAYVNDNRREIWGADAIRRFDHHGDIIVRARYDGDYDKTNLPEELVMTSYFSICEGKITSLTVIFNQPSPY
jgi:hypothetical protein